MQFGQGYTFSNTSITKETRTGTDYFSEPRLVEQFDKTKLITEMNSYSTVENAKYSVPMALELGADIIIVCSSAYQKQRWKAR